MQLRRFPASNLSHTHFFVVLYRNFRSLPFFGFIGFLNKAAKSLIYSYPPECSQDINMLLQALKPMACSTFAGLCNAR